MQLFPGMNCCTGDGVGRAPMDQNEAEAGLWRIATLALGSTEGDSRWGAGHVVQHLIIDWRCNNEGEGRGP